MKRIVVLLSVLLVSITGCVNLNTYSIETIVNKVIKKDNKLKNMHFEGYNYYIPRGYKFINKKQYNAYLMDAYNNHYYVYVDVVSKYNNVKKKYKTNKKAYYSKEIKNKGKFGYLEITKYNDNYFIEAMYNYMKVEAYVKEDNLKDSLTDIGLMLSSVKYNRKILNTIVGENKFSYKEEKFNIFETKNNKTDFLDYVKEYDYDKNEVDEDNIKVDEE